MSTRPRTPKYRHPKARGLAVVTLDGQDHYLGPYDSPESWEKYHRLLAEHLKQQRVTVASRTDPTIDPPVDSTRMAYLNPVFSRRE